jgi:hypothetical protein
MVRCINRQSFILQDSIYESAEEPSENGAGGLIFIEYPFFGLQPVFEGMAILSAMLLIQGIGLLRDARMDDLGMLIRLVSAGVLVAP